jgi:intracellular septation protein
MNPFVKFAIDLGPVLVFFAAYGTAGIMAATAAFMVATIASLAVGYALERRIALLPLVTGAIVLVFGGLTLIFDNELFIKLKPTVVNGLLGLALFGGLAFNAPILRTLFSAAFQLDERGWRILSLRWAWFFLAMAVLNEIVWRHFSTDTWVAFKAFGYTPLTLVFSVAQVPLIRRHSTEAKESA